MKQSDQINELAAALAAAQPEIKNAVANATNPHFRSSYADLEAVKAACLPSLNKHGIAVVQSPVVNDSRVGVVTRLVHKSGQWLEGEFTMPSVKQDPQGYGSALTYARRYTLAAFAGVATGEDDDGEGAHGRTENITKEKPVPQPSPSVAAKPTAKPTAKPEAKADKLPESVAALKPGGQANFSARTVEKIWQPEGKKTKRVKFQGDPTHYVTFHRMEEVDPGQTISGTIKCEEMNDGAIYYAVESYQPF